MTHDPYGPRDPLGSRDPLGPDRPYETNPPRSYFGEGNSPWVWIGGLAVLALIVGVLMWGGSVNEGEQTARTDSVSPSTSAPATAPKRETTGSAK